MDENSIPFIITDPPYLLEFMGKKFDKQHKDLEGENEGQKMQKWHTGWLIEAYRVLKPGGYLVAFGGTRTSHRLACAMEDVGFEIRDTMMWIYGSGFPKSLDISKAIDKRMKVKREVIGSKGTYADIKRDKETGQDGLHGGIAKNRPRVEVDITKPATDEAKKWNGWGTALKPAYEPIIIAMKPVSKSFVDNALNEGVAGINIDGSRVATNKNVDDMLRKVERNERQSRQWRDGSGFKNEHNELTGVREDGRFPANVILQHHEECKKIGTATIKEGNPDGDCDKGISSTNLYGWNKSDIYKSGQHYGEETIEEWECHKDCPVRIMNEQSGISKSGGGSGEKSMGALGDNIYGKYNKKLGDNAGGLGDSGGAARFFYTAKASKSERNIGLEGMKKDFHRRDDGQPYGMNTNDQRPDGSKRKEVESQENFHPTVKPVDLLIYLVRMFSTPDGGTVYDPFTGSGTTGIACKILDRPFIGSETEADYFVISKKRLQYDWKTWWAKGKSDDFVRIKKEIREKFFE